MSVWNGDPTYFAAVRIAGGGHPCSSCDGRCLRCGAQGTTGGCPVCPMPIYASPTAYEMSGPAADLAWERVLDAIRARGEDADAIVVEAGRRILAWREALDQRDPDGHKETR